MNSAAIVRRNTDRFRPLTLPTRGPQLTTSQFDFFPHSIAQPAPQFANLRSRRRAHEYASVASQRLLPSCILLGLCWIWGTYGTISTRLKRWRAIAASLWTSHLFARLTSRAASSSPP